jgi:hypothetical protein
MGNVLMKNIESLIVPLLHMVSSDFPSRPFFPVKFAPK